MPINKVQTYDSIKLIGAIVIIVLGLLMKVEKTGETEENIFFQDYYLQQEEKNILPEISSLEETHNSAPDIKDICGPQDILCQKIKGGQDSEVIPYKNQLHTVTYFVNNNQTIEKKIVDAINQIELKNDISQKRGYATWYNIVININIIPSIKEFKNVAVHELGHILDLGVIQGDKKTKNRDFTEFNKVVFASNDPSILFYKLSRDSEKVRKKESSKKDFCSGYGMSNPFEDFSECFNLYINNQSFFKTIAKQSPILQKKYNFIATAMQGKYIEKNLESLALLKGKKDRRPRDTTKL